MVFSNGRPLFSAMISAVGIALAASASAQDVHVTIHADRVLHRVSPYLAGACLEDVNHEVYGGIYSQLLFGESFQESAIMPPPQGFRVLGGQWIVRDGELLASGIPGDKLVSETPSFTNGEVHVEVYIPDRQTTNAGLIVRVGKATTGMDTFDGYEVSLNAAAQQVLLGRHRHNWEHIRDTPCEIPVGQWVPLSVKLHDRVIEISVNGKSVVKYEDDEKALLSGTVGLRQFQKEAKYRKLWIKTGEETRQLEFKSVAELPEVSGMWRTVRTGTATGSFALETKEPFVGRQSQRITFVDGQGEVGVENQGLNRWGVHFVDGRRYEGTLWARSEKPVDLFVSLQSRDGSQTQAESKLAVKPGEWQRLNFELTPKGTVERGRFAISLRQPGSVELGYALLQPGEWGRFKRLPVRRDVAEGLIDQGIRVLRYGGSMINHPEYRWKKMVGPRDRRPPHVGTWYPHSTNGWGIVEFLDLCDAAGFLSIPAFNMDETPEDIADFIDYVNGPATTEWGRRRSEGSHPAPYQLKTIQLGNEERVDEVYFAKFAKLAEAIWKHDPQITIVVGDFLYGEPIRDPFQFKGSASQITTLAAHQKILQLAKMADREVWFDVHVGTDGPRPDSTLAGTFSFVDALEKIADGARFKVAVFELNSGNHSQRRALGNALAISAIARDGRIPVVAAANCLQPDGQNDNDWNQGLLFLNPSQVWLQPPGYVTQMVASHYQPKLVHCESPDCGDRLDVMATISDDGKTLVLQAINATDRYVTSQIELKGFVPEQQTAKGLELSGPLAATNTAVQPIAIVPQQREWKHSLTTKPTSYSFPPHSITMLRLK